MSHTVMTASQPGPGVHIRRARPRDAAMLAAFGARVFAETFGSLNRPEDMAAHLARTYSPDRQAREIADSSLTYFLAEASGAMAGYALLRAGPAPVCVATPRPIEILRFYDVGSQRFTLGADEQTDRVMMRSG